MPFTPLNPLPLQLPLLKLSTHLLSPLALSLVPTLLSLPLGQTTSPLDPYTTTLTFPANQNAKYAPNLATLPSHAANA